MNDLFLLMLMGLLVAMFLNWNQKAGGCMPIVALAIGSLLFALLMIGR